MTDSFTRRKMMAASALLLPGFAQAAEALFAVLEKQSGARIGAAALDTASGKRITWRADERFVMCSTFKLSLAAATLERVDRNAEHLDEMIHYGKDVPLGVSPATIRNLDRGMTVAELCEAAVIYSDNGAANLLLERLGEPAAMTRFWRSLGDRLLGWMHANTTGGAMLRAGLPADWTIGDKTGRNPDFGFTNDLAITTPPGREPILIVVYTARATPETVAAAGKIIAERFA